MRFSNALARWFVPKMVKNGLYSSFVNWSLIWVCLTGNLDRVEITNHGIPSKLDGSRVFPLTVEATSSPSETSRHRGGLKTGIYLKTVSKPENRNYYHFTPN